MPDLRCDKYPGFILENKGGVYYGDALAAAVERIKVLEAALSNVIALDDGLLTPFEWEAVYVTARQIAKRALGQPVRHEMPPLRYGRRSDDDRRYTSSWGTQF
jgi:hypothetical protein